MTKAKPTKPRLGRPPSTDSADTRRRILDLARHAFATLGYEAATNRNLGAEANLTAGALYYYFGSKLDLYIAVYEDAQERVYSQFDEVLKGQTTFRGKLEAVLDAAHDMNKQDPSLAQFLGAMRVDVRRHPELGAALRHSSPRREGFYNQIVDVGVETGEIDPSLRDQVSALVLTLLVGLTDAVSEDLDRHRLAIDGIKGLLEGKLIRPAP